MGRNYINLDFNATTPILPTVWEAMRPFATEVSGNPASAHALGRRARQALEEAREKTAVLLDALPDEVVFTSGATEANNLAIFGQAGESPARLVCSPIEHPCVLEPIRRLGERGFAIEWLPVDASGAVPLAALTQAADSNPRLISLMLANHETGAIQPVAGELHAAFHCDAAQAVGKIPVRFHALRVATLTLSAHKFYGPKGIGALLIRRGTHLAPLFLGGHQQGGRRPGTEPVALAVGLAAALEIAEQERESRLAHVARLRNRMLSFLRQHASPVVLNGPEMGGLPHALNLSFPGCRADALLMNLDLAGVACSTGSACSSGSLLPSPVLQAMGVPDEVLHSAMRFSLSHLLSDTQVDEAAQRIAAVVRRVRGQNAETSI